MFIFKQPKAGKFVNSGSITVAVIIIAVLILLGTSVYIVDATEEAVITRFGRYLDTKGPGLQFKLPFGIDRHYLVNVTTFQTEEFGFRTLRGGGTPGHTRNEAESNMLTGDLNIIDISWIIQYQVSNAREWTFNVNERIPTIRDVSRSVINQLAGDRAIMNIMGERTVMQTEAAIMMNEIFRSYGLGITVRTVEFQNTTPPPGRVQEAFLAVNAAIQQRAQLINEGQQVYNEQIPRTKGEADRQILVAQGYATERVNMARGDIARFNSVLAEYQRAPEVTRQRLYYEMMEEVFANEQGTTLIDHNLRNFLPLMNMGGSR